MARIKYGSIITDLKGNIGGHTFQKGNVYSVVRSKGAGAKRPITDSSNTRKIVSSAISWNALNSIQKDSFAAISPSWPFVDKFGNVYYGSAYQVYVAYQTGLQIIQQPMVTSAGIPTSAQSYGDVIISSIDSSMNASIENLTDNSQMLLIYMSAPNKAGVNPKYIKYKLVTMFDTKFSIDADITLGYTSTWGSFTPGQTIYYWTACRPYAFPKQSMVAYNSFVCGSL